MTTTPSPTPPVANFQGAIADFSEDAATAFDKARSTVNAGLESDATPEEKDAGKAAQGPMTAALGQLSTAATMESTEVGRVGYSAVVALMQTTADTADKVCSVIVTTAQTAPIDYQLIAVLTGVLQQLAALSPVDVWKPPPSAGG